MAKQLHFNKDGSALKKMQAGVDKLASVVGITLGPKVHARLISPKICKDVGSAQLTTGHALHEVYVVL